MTVQQEILNQIAIWDKWNHVLKGSVDAIRRACLEPDRYDLYFGSGDSSFSPVDLDKVAKASHAQLEGFLFVTKEKPKYRPLTPKEAAAYLDEYIYDEAGRSYKVFAVGKFGVTVELQNWKDIRENGMYKVKEISYESLLTYKGPCGNPIGLLTS